MINLPQSTEVKCPLPRVGLYKLFDWKPSKRSRFDGDVSHLDFVNRIALRTLPAVDEGTEIAGKEVFSVDDDYLLACFDKDVNETTIEEMAKLFPTHLVIRYASAANDNVLDNFDQIIESYSNEKKITTHIL